MAKPKGRIWFVFCAGEYILCKNPVYGRALTLGNSWGAYGGRAVEHCWCRIWSWWPIISVLGGALGGHWRYSPTPSRSPMSHRCMEMADNLTLWDKSSDSAHHISIITLCVEFHQAHTCHCRFKPRDSLLMQNMLFVLVFCFFVFGSFLALCAGVIQHISHCLSVSDLIYVRRFRSGLLWGLVGVKRSLAVWVQGSWNCPAASFLMISQWQHNLWQWFTKWGGS